MKEELFAMIFEAMDRKPIKNVEDQQLLNLGFNSVSFIKFIVSVENKYGVEFEDEYLDFARYSSSGELFDYIDRLVSNSQS